MFCIYCGKARSDDAATCGFCGRGIYRSGTPNDYLDPNQVQTHSPITNINQYIESAEDTSAEPQPIQMNRAPQSHHDPSRAHEPPAPRRIPLTRGDTQPNTPPPVMPARYSGRAADAPKSKFPARGIGLAAGVLVVVAIAFILFNPFGGIGSDGGDGASGGNNSGGILGGFGDGSTNKNTGGYMDVAKDFNSMTASVMNAAAHGNDTVFFGKSGWYVYSWSGKTEDPIETVLRDTIDKSCRYIIGDWMYYVSGSSSNNGLVVHKLSLKDGTIQVIEGSENDAMRYDGKFLYLLINKGDETFDLVRFDPQSDKIVKTCASIPGLVTSDFLVAGNKAYVRPFRYGMGLNEAAIPYVAYDLDTGEADTPVFETGGQHTSVDLLCTTDKALFYTKGYSIYTLPHGETTEKLVMDGKSMGITYLAHIYPQGDMVYFSARKEGSDIQLYRIGADGKKLQKSPIIEGEGFRVSNNWLCHGSSAFYIDGDNITKHLTLKDGEVVQVFDTPLPFEDLEIK